MKNASLLILSIFIISFQSCSKGGFASEKPKAEQTTADSATTKKSTSTTNADFTVEVVGLASDAGTLKVAVYGSEELWLSQSEFKQSSPIVNGKAAVVFKNIPTGTYAISTYHDENSNEKLDVGNFGIPTEPYASSRGASGRFGPPSWSDAKFEITNTTHTEEIKY